MNLKERLKTISTRPGVYQMKNDKGQILYIGKAKNLKRRVASYFAKDHSDSPKTRELVKRIADVEMIVVEKEIEALILENELIKQHRPPFNVVMRDDKTYLYIRAGVSDDFPTISFVRRPQKDDAKYFGPFVDARSARRTVQLLQRVLPLCTAQKVGRPCLNYHIGRCLGVCTGEISVTEYRKVFERVVDFLSGRYGQILKKLELEMQIASGQRQFERAARLRDGIVAIKKIAESQSVVSPSLREAIDVVGVGTRANRSVITLMQVRRGKIMSQMPFVMESQYESTTSEILAGFLRDYYANIDTTPNAILTSEMPKDASLLEKWLSAKDKHRVKIVVPTRGLKKRLLKIASANASAKFEEVAKRLNLETRFATEGIAELKKKLGLKKLERIEAYDISNTQGADSVGVMVVFERGKMINAKYRRFKIKSVVGSNDYASMAEVLIRRFAKKSGDKKFATYPELVLIDGGKGQTNVVAKALGKFKFKLIGMAKGDHSAPKAKDEVVVYGQVKPLGLAKNSPAKYLLQQIRDEAHRFALGYHTNIKRKQMRESALEAVAGVGPATRKKLIRKFGSLAGVRSATERELAEVVGEKKAKSIRGQF
ncbi:MAG: excinuclease ABC subunit UvrC [Patescibacteria group bacterium]|nr:excinuclease ABC subunit UvrC [Patescibacteria group bacterium]